jgi:hypothetical protein
MEKLIKKILKEESFEKLLNSEIELNGIFATAKLVGGIDSLKEKIKTFDDLPREIKIGFINDIIRDIEPVIEELSIINDMDEYEIFFEEVTIDVTGKERGYITELQIDSAIIDYYGGKGFDIFMGEGEVYYTDMEEELLNEIFDIVLEYYSKIEKNRTYNERFN